MDADTVSTEEVLLWKADNVADWLITIGLKKYVNKFKRYVITGPILLQLDDTLLDDLDIPCTIDRKALLESVDRFTGNIEECLQGECKATKFPAALVPEVLPTIGEEDDDELEEKNKSNKTSISISFNNTDEKDLGNQRNQDDDKESIKSTSGKKQAHVILPEDMASMPTENLSSPVRKDVDEVASRATQMVQIFSEENMCLRNQLEKCCQELRHLQNVKKDLHDSQIMYKDLKGAFINREHKEKAMRMRLEAEITQLQNINAELTEELREAQDMLTTRPKDELKIFKEEINKRDEIVKQLQNERKNSNTSLHNLERMLKRKSSDVINLQQQLDVIHCNECGSNLKTKQMHEKKDIKESNQKIDPLKYRKSTQKSCSRGTRFPSRTFNSLNPLFPTQQRSGFDVPTCVSVLIALLKEKDTEITRLREETSQMASRLTCGTEENDWLENSDEINMVARDKIVHNNTETYVQYRNDEKRYSDLETAIKTLHVEVAEKDAVIKILQCKYGDCKQISQNSSSILSTPLRSPSFTSQGSSGSSYQDSGIVTTADYRDTSHQDMKANFKDDMLPLRELEFETTDHQHSSMQEEEQVNDHCWFV